MRKLLLALAFAAAPPVVNAAPVHSQNNAAVIASVIVAQQPAITSLPSASLTIALVLPVDAGGVVARAAAGFYDECRNMQTNADNNADKDARFVLYGTDGKESSSAGAYQKAANDGASMIIGPLLQKNVAALLRRYADAPVPTLLLQPGGGDNYFFITAEAGREAAGLAEIIHFAGATEVLIVAQESELATRQMRGFIRQWQTINDATPDLFRPDDSQWQSLFDLLREAAEAENRMAVFAAGDAAFARRVRHFAPSYHPVFAGSFSYDGAAFADDIYMMAMPQMLTPPDDDTSSAIIRRFRALGNDACYLALQADKWSAGFGYDGKSGAIVLTGNEFRRRGVLARQSGGKLHKALPPPFAR